MFFNSASVERNLINILRQNELPMIFLINKSMCHYSCLRIKNVSGARVFFRFLDVDRTEHGVIRGLVAQNNNLLINQ